MRDYHDFDSPIYKYTINASRPLVIERLKVAATNDAAIRGYFPDTGLVGVDNIERDFDSVQYTLIYTENLVNPIHRTRAAVYPSTFGVMGEDHKTGQWRVCCWIQPSALITREIQIMVKEKKLITDQVIQKHQPDGSRGRGLHDRMSIQEHEMIWSMIHGWDQEMRGMWWDSFQQQ